MEDKVLKEDFIKIVQNAKKNSCVEEKIPRFGESYIAPQTKSRKKNDKKLKQAIQFIAVIAATAAITTGVAVATGSADFAAEVRSEVNDTYMDQNVMGGRFVDKYEHDSEFRDYVSNLNDFQLTKLYNETSDELKDAGMVDAAGNIHDVVDEMEKTYLEDSRKSK